MVYFGCKAKPKETEGVIEMARSHARYRRSMEIIPGVKLTTNKKSVGLTISIGGVKVTKNSFGEKTTTVGSPVPGLFWTERTKGRR